MPSSRTRACQRGSASESSVACVSGRRYKAVGSRSSAGCHSYPPSRSLPTVSRRWRATPTMSPRFSGPSSSSAACPITLGWTWRCDTRKISRPPCTTLGRLSVVRQPHSPRRPLALRGRRLDHLCCPGACAGGRPGTGCGQRTTSGRTFRRLTPVEMQERRRQGLCYNCDEPYVPGHVCERLFYLECGDYIIEELRPRKSQTLRQRSCPNRSMVRLTLLSCRSTLLQGSARR